MTGISCRDRLKDFWAMTVQAVGLYYFFGRKSFRSIIQEIIQERLWIEISDRGRALEMLKIQVQTSKYQSHQLWYVLRAQKRPFVRISTSDHKTTASDTK